MIVVARMLPQLLENCYLNTVAETCYQNTVAGGRFNALATARIDLLPMTCKVPSLQGTAAQHATRLRETLDRNASAWESALSFLLMTTLVASCKTGIPRCFVNVAINLKMKYETRGDVSRFDDSSAAPSLYLCAYTSGGSHIVA
jgi:hypothetical protein